MLFKRFTSQTLRVLLIVQAACFSMAWADNPPMMMPPPSGGQATPMQPTPAPNKPANPAPQAATPGGFVDDGGNLKMLPPADGKGTPPPAEAKPPQGSQLENQGVPTPPRYSSPPSDNQPMNPTGQSGQMPPPNTPAGDQAKAAEIPEPLTPPDQVASPQLTPSSDGQ